MHGASVTAQVLVTVTETNVPHGLRPDARIGFVRPPQTAVTVLLKVKNLPGARVATFVIDPTTLSTTVIFVRVTLPQFVTAPLMVCGAPTRAVEQSFVTVMHGASVVRQTLVA